MSLFVPPKLDNLITYVYFCNSSFWCYSNCVLVVCVCNVHHHHLSVSFWPINSDIMWMEGEGSGTSSVLLLPSICSIHYSSDHHHMDDSMQAHIITSAMIPLTKVKKSPNHTWPTLLVGSLWMNHWLNPYIRYVLHANHQKNTRVDCEGGHLISPRRILPKLPNQQNRWKAKVKLLSPRNHFSKWYHLKWMTRNYWVSDIGSLLSIWKASLSFSGTVRSISSKGRSNHPIRASKRKKRRGSGNIACEEFYDQDEINLTIYSALFLKKPNHDVTLQGRVTSLGLGPLLAFERKFEQKATGTIVPWDSSSKVKKTKLHCYSTLVDTNIDG